MQRRPVYENLSFCYITKGAESEQSVEVQKYSGSICTCFCKLMISDSLSLLCQVMPILPPPALAVLVITAVNDLHTVGLYLWS